MKKLIFILLLLPFIGLTQDPVIDVSGNPVVDAGGNIVESTNLDQVILDLAPVVWLRADNVELNGSLITQFNDLSGNGNNATQGTASKQATQTSTAGLQTTAQYDGDDIYSTSAGIFSITTGTMVVISHKVGVSAFRDVYACDLELTTQGKLSISDDNKIYMQGNAEIFSTAGTWNNTDVYIIGSYGSTDSLDVNGTVTTGSIANPVSFDGLRLGGNGSYFLTGYMSDYILFDYVLTNEQKSIVVTGYINEKYPNLIP